MIHLAGDLTGGDEDTEDKEEEVAPRDEVEVAAEGDEEQNLPGQVRNIKK